MILQADIAVIGPRTPDRFVVLLALRNRFSGIELVNEFAFNVTR